MEKKNNKELLVESMVLKNPGITTDAAQKAVEKIVEVAGDSLNQPATAKNMAETIKLIAKTGYTKQKEKDHENTQISADFADFISLLDECVAISEKFAPIARHNEAGAFVSLLRRNSQIAFIISSSNPKSIWDVLIAYPFLLPS
jgi:hypothetical protein